MRRLRRLVHLVLLCPFSKGLQVSGSRPGAATRGGAGRGTARVDGCTRAHRSPFFPLLLQKKFRDSKLGTYPAPGQSLRQLELGAMVTLGQWRTSSYLQKRPLRSCFEVMGSGHWAPASGCPGPQSLQKGASIRQSGRGLSAGPSRGCWRMLEDAGGCLCPGAWPALDCFR